MTSITDPPGARMSYWIAKTLKREREAAGIDVYRMAEIMGVNWRTIERWEIGDTYGRKTELDRAIAGYAHVLGYEDARELWELALEQWYKEGAPPEFMASEDSVAAFVEALRIESLRRRPRDARERPARQPSDRKKTAD